MSFLLEALRKSENQKNAGVVPTIHSTSDLVSGPRKLVSPKLLLLIILPALVVALWFAWQWLDRPSLRAAAPSTVGPEASVPAEAPTAAIQNETLPEMPSSPAQGRPLENETTVVEANRLLPEIPEYPENNKPSVSKRTPVEAYEAPQQDMVQTDADDGGSVRIGVQSPGMDQQINPVSGPGGSSKKNIPVQEDEQQGPKPVSYWQLPESIRQEMPAPRISVLVFADRTEDRFIIMNGKRLGHGDEVMTGMRLEEIRRNGVVFSYRHYHFLVSR